MDQPQVVSVTSAAALARAVDDWRTAPAIALDTEFVRERTYYARLGLVQVSNGSAVWLLDPLAVEDLTPLAAVFSNPDVLKVVHSASEDLELLRRVVGALPRPFLDTQIAAGLAGVGSGLGYQRLIAQVLGVELFKGETRTDWLRRPLSPEQLEYAAEDVSYLLPAWQTLRDNLTRLGRLEWAIEDSSALVAEQRFVEDDAAAWQRIKAAPRLERRALAALRSLAAWREGEARRRDLPRGFVLKDDLMLQLAVRQPKTRRDLERLPALDVRQSARDGGTWLALLREVAELPSAVLPAAIAAVPETPEAETLERRLRALVRARAEALGLPPEALFTRRQLETVLKSALLDRRPRLPDTLSSWRRREIGEQLLAEARAAVDGASG